MDLYGHDARYHNDPVFHAVVDSMQKILIDLQLTPGELRDAAMYAAYLVEMRRPNPIKVSTPTKGQER